MKKFVLVLITFLLVSCQVSKNLVTDDNRVSSHLSYLSSDELEGRKPGELGIEKAAQYLTKELKTYGIKPYFKTYNDTLVNIDRTAYNIVGYIEGKDKILKSEFVVIGAHYDHIGKVSSITTSKEIDNIYNGANDNATGVTAVLEVARNLSKQKLKRSALIVFFSAEEMGLLGAEHLSKKLKEQNINLYTMINFEMLGVPMEGKGKGLIYISGEEMSNMGAKINEYSGDKGFIGKNKISQMVFGSADNYPFYKNFNIPSHTFCSFDFDNYQYYHHLQDEFSKMNISHMTKIINKVNPAIVRLINSPTREVVLK